MKQILALSRARKSYDGKVVLDDVTLGFLPGAKIGVVGPNGTGKSTLLRLMAGLEQPSNGEVVFAPGCTRGILAQEPALSPSLSLPQLHAPHPTQLQYPHSSTRRQRLSHGIPQSLRRCNRRLGPSRPSRHFGLRSFLRPGHWNGHQQSPSCRAGKRRENLAIFRPAPSHECFLENAHEPAERGHQRLTERTTQPRRIRQSECALQLNLWYLMKMNISTPLCYSRFCMTHLTGLSSLCLWMWITDCYL